MKKHLIPIIIGILFIPNFLFADIITFKLGYFIPRANGELWESEVAHLTFNRSSFNSFSFCLGYEFFLSDKISLALNLEGFSKKARGYYKVNMIYSEKNEEGREIELFVPYDQKKEFFRYKHEFRVGITPILVSAKVYPLGRTRRLHPFLGGGTGLYLWSAAVDGAWFDFRDERTYHDEDSNEDVSGYLIEYEVQSENKVTIGWHLLGGVMLPIGKKLTFDLELKHYFAEGKFSEFFSNFGSFDISGFQIFIGLNYVF